MGTTNERVIQCTRAGCGNTATVTVRIEFRTGGALDWPACPTHADGALRTFPGAHMTPLNPDHP